MKQNLAAAQTCKVALTRQTRFAAFAPLESYKMVDSLQVALSVLLQHLHSRGCFTTVNGREGF